MEQLPLTKYLSLSESNMQTKSLLDSYVINDKTELFAKVASNVLSITQQESQQLFATLSIIDQPNHASTQSGSTGNSVTSSNIISMSTTMSPPTTHSGSQQNVVYQSMFADIEQYDNYMNTHFNENSEEFQQNSILIKIFKIPNITGNTQQITRDRIDCIKDMQAQYEEHRLPNIGLNKLTQEFEIRQNILNTNRDLKSKKDILFTLLNDEINQSVILKKMMNLNTKNRHKTKNEMNAQYELQEILNQTELFISLLEDLIAQIKTYSIDRNLIFEVQNRFYAKINEKNNKVNDQSVTSYLLNQLTNLNALLRELSKKTIDFKVHIQSSLYVKHIGSLQNIKMGHQNKKKQLKEDRENYRITANISKIYNGKIKQKEVNRIYMEKKRDIIETIKQINSVKQISISSIILESNGICEKWIIQQECNDDQCQQQRHKIPETIKTQQSGSKRSLQHASKPKKKKQKQKHIYTSSKQSKMFKRFFKPS